MGLQHGNIITNTTVVGVNEETRRCKNEQIPKVQLNNRIFTAVERFDAHWVG